MISITEHMGRRDPAFADSITTFHSWDSSRRLRGARPATNPDRCSITVGTTSGQPVGDSPSHLRPFGTDATRSTTGSCVSSTDKVCVLSHQLTHTSLHRRPDPSCHLLHPEIPEHHESTLGRAPQR